MGIDFGAILDVVGALMVLAGACFTFVAALGLVRLPDLFSRSPRCGEATTLGADADPGRFDPDVAVVGLGGHQSCGARNPDDCGPGCITPVGAGSLPWRAGKDSVPGCGPA